MAMEIEMEEIHERKEMSDVEGVGSSVYTGVHDDFLGVDEGV